MVLRAGTRGQRHVGERAELASQRLAEQGVGIPELLIPLEELLFHVERGAGYVNGHGAASVAVQKVRQPAGAGAYLDNGVPGLDATRRHEGAGPDQVLGEPIGITERLVEEKPRILAAAPTRTATKRRDRTAGRRRLLDAATHAGTMPGPASLRSEMHGGSPFATAILDDLAAPHLAGHLPVIAPPSGRGRLRRPTGQVAGSRRTAPVRSRIARRAPAVFRRRRSRRPGPRDTRKRRN